MKSLRILLALALAIALPANVFAHGGGFKGPPGGVAPGLRSPSDPEPPPPPPSDPPGPGGPVSGGDDDPAGPVTPPDHTGGPESGGGGQSPVGPAPTTGTGRKVSDKSLTYESWRFWWEYNKQDILDLKKSLRSNDVSSASPLIYASNRNEDNRRDPQRATKAAIDRIKSTLLAAVNDPRNHEDIQGGALVALGKIGDGDLIPMFREAIWNRYRTPQGVRMDFGYQATESAVLALGLLRRPDAPSVESVRRICLEAIADDTLRTRERAWAAVSLGLQQDLGAVQPLLDLLKKSYKNDNIPAGILVGLGLIGDSQAVPALSGIFVTAKYENKRVSATVQSFAGYALLKIGDPAGLEAVLKVARMRRIGPFVKRTAAIAVGVLAADADRETKDKAVQRLLRMIRNSEPTTRNFATISLGKIGSPRAVRALLAFASDAPSGQRSFAALSLGAMVHYADRDAAEGEAWLDATERAKIVTHLAKLSEKFKAKDLKAAFYLARGLCKDERAIDDLVAMAGKHNEDPVLRGYCCVALGLIGKGTTEAKDAVLMALKERKNPGLRVNAAIGLGLLKDAGVMDVLLKELEAARSFAVHGQLISAIGMIGDHRAIEPLTRLLEDPKRPAQIRAMAAVGLGMIGDLEMPRLSRLSTNYNYRATVRDLDELLFIL